MSDDIFQIPLADAHKKLLLELVDKANKAGVMSFSFFWHTPDDLLYYLDFPINKKESIQYKLNENPIPGFEALGFIKYDEKQKKIFLLPKLQNWAKYEKKSGFGKFWARQSLKDIMLGIAFILSLALTFFQVIEILQKLKILP